MNTRDIARRDRLLSIIGMIASVMTMVLLSAAVLGWIVDASEASHAGSAVARVEKPVVLASGSPVPPPLPPQLSPYIAHPIPAIPLHVQQAQVLRPQAPLNPRPGPPRRGAVVQ